MVVVVLESGLLVRPPDDMFFLYFFLFFVLSLLQGADGARRQIPAPAEPELFFHVLQTSIADQNS